MSNRKAYEYTKVYSEDRIFLEFFDFFDKLFNKLDKLSLKQALESIVSEAPNEFKEAFIKAIEIKDTDTFIKEYAVRACPIKHALPVIIHLLYHMNSYEEAIKASALIGGAVSDRNMLFGAIFAQVSEVPKDWINKVNI